MLAPTSYLSLSEILGRTMHYCQGHEGPSLSVEASSHSHPLYGVLWWTHGLIAVDQRQQGRMGAYSPVDSNSARAALTSARAN